MPLNNQIIVPKYIDASGRFQETVLTPLEINAYSDSNPSGFITGVDLSSYYLKSNPSGFITNKNVVFTTGNQTISGIKSFATNTVFQDNLFYISQPSGKISGSGYTGYYDGGIFLGRTKLSQNNIRISNIGDKWVQRTTDAKEWSSISISSDGKYQTAVADKIYISNDYGNTWTPKESDRLWNSVSVSSDGKYQTAVANNDYIYISKDYGNTWSGAGLIQSWQGVAISSDGKYQTASSNTNYGQGNIYISDNYGYNWTLKITGIYGLGAAMSSDGKYQSVVTRSSKPIYISNDYGNTWTHGTGLIGCQQVSMSSDGKYQTAVAYTGIYISNNYGNTWKIIKTRNGFGWWSVAVSSDGKHQIALDYGGIIDISENYGNTWSEKNFYQDCYSISMSSDAKYLSAAVYYGQIHTSVSDEKIDGNFIADNIYANNLIYNTGNQTISGLKDFASRPTVNAIPVALSGEASSSIEQWVKNDYGATLYKGQPVYVSGSNGNNILIHPASNSGEGTSSKTFGLLKQTLLNNEQGYVVTEGPLFNVNTSMAAEGDPIWLGPTGNLIYGLINKPKAPQHLVYLGFVERAHQNQGKIFVKVQNGFEIEELHDVRIVNKQNSDIIIYNSGSGLWLNSGVNFGNFATNNNLAATGSALQENINSLSGVSVLTFGNQIINGTKYFNENVYIHDLYVTGTEFIANVQNNFIESSYILLNLTGGAIDGGIFFVTGSGLTGINDYGPIIGFDHSNKFKFGIARRSDDLSILNDIASAQDITNYSGFVNSNFYPANNPNGYITGIDLSNYATTSNLELTGQNLQLQLNNKANLTDIYNAAVEWTTNHTLVDGTRYLAGDLVYVSGKIYKANFDNESIPVTSALYWTDLGAGYRLNIDGRDIPNIPISTAIQTGLNSKYDASNPSGFITSQNVIYTSGNQIKSGRLIIASDEAGVVDPNSTYTLSIQTNSSDTWLEILNYSGASQGAFFGMQGDNFEQWNYQGGDIIFYTAENPSNGYERLRIKNNGEANFALRPFTNNTGVLLIGEALPAQIISWDINSTISQENNAEAQTIDIISDGVQLTRGTYGVLYNPLYDSEGAPNPTNTEWNEDGWADLSDLASRTYTNLNMIGGGGSFGSAVVGTELIMRDTSTNKYYKFLFSGWQQGAGGNPNYRGFEYVRTEIGNQYQVNNKVDFTIRPTVNGTGVLLSGEATNGGTANFRYAPSNGIINLLSNNRYSVNTVSGSSTGILPQNPEAGDEIELYDIGGAWNTNPLIIDNNGNYIEQKLEQLECNVRNGLIKLIYTPQNNVGWKIYPMPIHSVPSLIPPVPAIATYTTSGYAPLTGQFSGINLADPAISPVDHWYWDVSGDSAPEFDQSVITYVFNETGTYTFYLTAANSVGSGTASGIITVLEVPPPTGSEINYSNYISLLLHFNP